MKKLLYLFAFILLLYLPGFASQNDQALVYLNRLYCPKGQPPVSDIVVEYEEMSSDGRSAMSLSSKDKIYFKSPYKIRLDSILVDPGNVNDGKNLIIIRDGLNAWLYLSTGQYPVKKQLDQPSPPLCLPFGLTHYPQDLNKNYTVKGKETVDGVPAVRIDITGGDSKASVWIDTSKQVPVKQELVSKHKGKEVKKMVLYKNIGKTADGRFFPMRLEKYVNNDLTTLIVYKGLVVNAGLEDSLFTPLEKLLK